MTMMMTMMTMTMMTMITILMTMTMTMMMTMMTMTTMMMMMMMMTMMTMMMTMTMTMTMKMTMTMMTIMMTMMKTTTRTTITIPAGCRQGEVQVIVKWFFSINSITLFIIVYSFIHIIFIRHEAIGRIMYNERQNGTDRPRTQRRLTCDVCCYFRPVTHIPEVGAENWYQKNWYHKPA